MYENIPRHIGIIPDGNRRFAKRLMKNPSKGHEWGAEKMKTVFGWCKELGIKNITVYSLSLENLKNRSKDELEFIFNIARREFADILENPDNFINRNNIKLNFIGRIDMLPQDLQETIKKVSAIERPDFEYIINFAIAYGGRQEIIEASRRIAQKVLSGELKPEEINEMIIRQNLYTNGQPDPDLIIRTGCEKRLSNFMTFQSAYSEFAFIDVYWPELTKEQFFAAIRDYSRRQRRFGK